MERGSDIADYAAPASDQPLGPVAGANGADAAAAVAKPGAWRRWLVPAVLLGGLAAAAWSSGHGLLSLEAIAEVHHRFHAMIAEHRVLAVLIYIIGYAGIVALSVPSAGLLTMAGGLFFGGLAGGAAAVVAATLGATGLFAITRMAAGDGAVAQLWPQIATLQDGFKRHAFSYLLFLRLVPVFPFCIVNIVPALVGIPLATFCWGTLIGIIPATFAISSVGAGLDVVITAANDQQAACVAAHVADCPLRIAAGSLLTPQMEIAIAVLSLLALLPVGVKYWRQHNGH